MKFTTHILRPPRWLAGGICAVVLCGYIGSYSWLSRRGITEAKAAHLEAFLYVPIDDVMASHDLTLHYRLRSLYRPLNAIDQALFGTMGPISGIMFEIC